MITKAVRLYGADDLRLEAFELPEIEDDEILVKVVSDSICILKSRRYYTQVKQASRKVE
jgi:threonine dehydrogenase-like Zn-dependent dehydrogenase